MPTVRKNDVQTARMRGEAMGNPRFPEDEAPGEEEIEQVEVDDEPEDGGEGGGEKPDYKSGG